jgi:hypothetical protein
MAAEIARAHSNLFVELFVVRVSADRLSIEYLADQGAGRGSDDHSGDGSGGTRRAANHSPGNLASNCAGFTAVHVRRFGSTRTLVRSSDSPGHGHLLRCASVDREHVAREHHVDARTQRCSQIERMLGGLTEVVGDENAADSER